MLRSKLMFLGILIVVVVGIAALKFIFVDSRDKVAGELIIHAVPDVTVFVDSQAYTKTPAHFSLAPGEHTVKLIPIAQEFEASGSARVPWEGKITISKNTTTKIQRELAVTDNESAGEILYIVPAEEQPDSGKGEIRVVTEPDGARVGFDGEDVATAPHIIRNVEPGVHEVSATLTKFRGRNTQIQVYPGMQTVVEFQLGLDKSFESRLGLTSIATTSGSTPDTLPSVPSAAPTVVKPKKVEVLDTPTGFLRVRDNPSLAGKQVTQVKPGESYDFLEEQGTWIKIKLTEGDGWVSSEYVKKIQ